MKGWKTLLGGLIQVGLGAFLIATGDIEKGVTLIGTGVSTIGLGHKLDKASK